MHLGRTSSCGMTSNTRQPNIRPIQKTTKSAVATKNRPIISPLALQDLAFHPLSMPKHPYKPIARALLHIYKATLSTVFYAFGVRCRHLPTCSEFGAEAASRHGWWVGGWMTVGRLWRCRPGGTHGLDEVPKVKPQTSVFTPWKLARWQNEGKSSSCDYNE